MKRAYKREGECHGKRWLQFHLIEAGTITHVHMVPAIITGWNVERIETDRDGFAGMTLDSIASYITANWIDTVEADPLHVEAVIGRYQKRQEATHAS